MGYLDYQAEKAAVQAPATVFRWVVRMLLFATLAFVGSIAVVGWALYRMARARTSARGARIVCAGMAVMGATGIAFYYEFINDISGLYPALTILLYLVGVATVLVGGRMAQHDHRSPEQPWEPLAELDRDLGLHTLKKASLLSLADAAQMPGRHSMRKDELLESLRAMIPPASRL
jgi:hypothetical protein